MKHRFTLLAALLVIGLAGGLIWFTRTSSDGELVGPAINSVNPTGGSLPSDEAIVVLSEAKLASAKLEVDSVEPRMMSASMVVAGRVQYNDTRHIEIRSATDCVVSEVLVGPGDRVQTGDVLAVLKSPEIGTARANVLQRRAELGIAEKTAAWERETCENIELLAAAIAARNPMKEVREQFENRKLGENRGALMSAYVRWDLAQLAITNVSLLTSALPERTMQERRIEVEAAQAAVRSVCEQATFDARRRCDVAESGIRDAGRRLKIAEQQLDTLLGHHEDVRDDDAAEDLSNVKCTAPFAGTIERKYLSSTERAKTGDALFVLADTSQMWIAADLREREWSVLNISPCAELGVESPALPASKLVAQVKYVGREVSAESNSIPLIATIDNSHGLLRPGLFVRVTLPTGKSEPRLAVPESAVEVHERRKFVFVRDTANTYRRVDVTTGLNSGGLVEITHGLTPGMMVVTRGTFLLKSELLLEAE